MMTRVDVEGPNPVDVHVGARIRLRRRVMGMSQDRLAESLGLTFQQVQKYERGVNRVSASKLYQMARTLKTSIGYFFEGLPDPDDGEQDAAADSLEEAVSRFLVTPEGMEMAAIFPRIEDGALRRQLLELVRTIVRGAEGRAEA